MKIQKTKLSGVFVIDNFYAKDNRGEFIKTFNNEFFIKNNLCSSYKESYYSISKKDVIRGMHFQLPPFDHEKLVYVIKGKVLDVVLDLRKNSVSFGDYFCIELTDSNNKSLYIPKGLAHGFKSLEDDTIMMYNVSTVYDKESDYGINYNSFGFDWSISNPVVSDRDLELQKFEDFKIKNPFV